MNNLISPDFMAWIIKIFAVALGIFYIIYSLLLLKKTLFMSRTIITKFDHVLNILTIINFLAALGITAALFLIAP